MRPLGWVSSTLLSALEVVRLVEETVLKTAGCNRFGGSIPSASVHRVLGTKETLTLFGVVRFYTVVLCGMSTLDVREAVYFRRNGFDSCISRFEGQSLLGR